jgi:hypothetical protein
MTFVFEFVDFLCLGKYLALPLRASLERCSFMQGCRLRKNVFALIFLYLNRTLRPSFLPSTGNSVARRAQQHQLTKKHMADQALWSLVLLILLIIADIIAVLQASLI